MANDPRPGLTPVETPCGQAMARNAGDMALSIICIHDYSCMYWICIQQPVKPGNLTQLYKKLRTPGIYQVELRPTWGRSPKVQAWHGFGDLWFEALFWTRLVSFGSETVQFFGGIVHFEPFSNDSWSVNHQPNMVIHTKNVVVSQKNCSPIDEQWEESSPFGWYIVIHHSEIKDMFGWFPFATNVMTSWWDHCNFNHDQWSEKDMGWYVALSTMWYSKPQIDRKMATRKLSGKHHRTNILHVFQRIGIIVIDVATTYNSNCTPSKISRKSELGNPKLMKSPGCSDEGPTQPGPLQRSFESYCGRWSDSMSFDEVWKEVGLSENGLSTNIPNLFSIGNFAGIFRPGCAPGFKLYLPQDSGPLWEILHADFLGVSDFVPRRMPLDSQKSVHSATNVSYFQWKIWQRRIWKICILS